MTARVGVFGATPLPTPPLAAAPRPRPRPGPPLTEPPREPEPGGRPVGFFGVTLIFMAAFVGGGDDSILGAFIFNGGTLGDVRGLGGGLVSRDSLFEARRVLGLCTGDGKVGGI